MGRGRQKAKQTKVARQLKYYSPDTDLNALQRELANGDSYSYAARTHEVDEEEFDDDEGEDWGEPPRR